MKTRLLAASCLVLLFLLSAVWLLSLDWKERLSTDIMELIPERSPSPELALGRSALGDVYANRVMIALRSVTDPQSVKAYREHLEASPLVGKVIDLTAVDAFADVGQFVFEHRFELLFPRWLAAQRDAAGADSASPVAQVVPDLESALNDPSFLSFEEIVPKDPLLLMWRAAEAFQAAQPTKAVDPSTYLLEVTLTVSALKSEGQGPVFDLLDEAQSAAAEYSPGIRVLDTGAHRYAAETEMKMREEVRHLNLSTALIVFLICAFFCRRITLVFHVFVILLLSLVAGVALMLCFFDQVHVFALIFGCVLCGVIVDYALHAYLHDAGAGHRSIGPFLKPFLISCGSTLMGFMILLLSDLPVLRQMGLLVICGLAMAVVVALVYVFAVLGPAPEAPGFFRSLKYPRRGGPWILGLGLVALLCMPFVHWEDDIRNLKYPLPHLDAVDAEIRNLHGGERRVLFTVGESYAASRAHLTALNRWLDAQGVESSERISAAAWVPDYADYLRAREFAQAQPDFGTAVLASLEQAAYEGAVFAPFEADWVAYSKGASTGKAEADYETLVASFSDVLAGGLSGIVGQQGTLYWWVSLVDASVDLAPLPADLHSLGLSQVESMSSVLNQYRERTLELSLLGGLFIYTILVLSFGFANGSRILLVPAIAIVSGIVAIYAGTGPLDIFHLIGLFLGACLVLDYAVFTWMGVRRSQEMPFSVIVSSLTTIASFCVLSWSRIPAIHALGMAVFWVTLIGVITTYIYIPHTAKGKERVDAQ